MVAPQERSQQNPQELSLRTESLPKSDRGHFKLRGPELQGKALLTFSDALIDLPRSCPWLSEAAQQAAMQVGRTIQGYPALSVRELSALVCTISATKSVQERPSIADRLQSLETWQTMINGACDTPSLESFCDRAWLELNQIKKNVLDERIGLHAVQERVRAQAEELKLLIGKASLNLAAYPLVAKKLAALQEEAEQLTASHDHASTMKHLKNIAKQVVPLEQWVGPKDLTKPLLEVKSQARIIIQEILIATIRELHAELRLKIPAEVVPYDKERLLLRTAEILRSLHDWSGRSHSLLPLQEEISRFRGDTRKIYRPVAKQILRAMAETLSAYEAFFPPPSQFDTP